MGRFPPTFFPSQTIMKRWKTHHREVILNFSIPDFSCLLGKTGVTLLHKKSLERHPGIKISSSAVQSITMHPTSCAKSLNNVSILRLHKQISPHKAEVYTSKARLWIPEGWGVEERGKVAT